ncbi:Nitrogen regulation protein NR(I) [Planctomycetes bacterium Pan216]|uniref:DNA-binding transcriptional regulator NtrC n=1 Tax=Kolteria novifilia TaxID=2527975 RepID=A0A518B0Z9_9BACT|nr:Nitrogen regulation protein NR(I) [Planctomycetes bacterium Pan216]
MDRLLVVDDDPLIHTLLQNTFTRPKYALTSVVSAEEGLESFRAESPDAVLLDVRLPDMSGLEAIERFTEIDATVPIIVITANGESDSAIEAMKLGAYDYLVKPLDLKHVGQLISSALNMRHLMAVTVSLGENPVDDQQQGEALIGNSATMREVYKSIGRVAPRAVTVLLRGESGTGKELVARAIYQHSQRAHRPFMAINCAAIPENLLESELFGHEKGAFTSADRLRIGKFEQCNGGTLFLDEVGDMPLPLQSKILRVLQEQRFQRVGGNETIATDVRIIAATHRDLERLVAEETFRADLYYRLNVVSIVLPPLRDRIEDLGPLVDHLVRRFGRELDSEVTKIAPDVLEMLANYPWPGNIRELQSALKQAIIQASGSILMVDHLPETIREPDEDHRSSTRDRRQRDDDELHWSQFLAENLEQGTTSLYADSIEHLERFLIRRVLEHTGGHQSHASEILGITRSSLRNKIRNLGIQIDQVVRAGEECDDVISSMAAD